MKTNASGSKNGNKIANKALERLFYHYNSPVSQIAVKSNNWNYLGFAIATRNNKK